MHEYLGTVVGLTFQNGAALASDTRTTYQYQVTSKRAQKIFKIQDNIGITTSGIGGDIQSLINGLKSEVNLYRLRLGKDITTKSLAQYASNLLHAYKALPYLAEIIIAGVDEKEPHIYFLDPLGGSLEEDKFASAGTGSTIAYGVLEQNYEYDMESEEGLELAAQSIQQAIERDAATGDKIVVAKIDGEGFKELSEEETKKLLK